MLPAWSLNIAIAVRLLGGASYLWAVLTGKARPNPLTWFFWSLTPAITFVAQLNAGVGNEAWVTCALAAGPFAVFCTSIIKNRLRGLRISAATLLCGMFALLGIVLWRTTDDPTLAIGFSMFADGAASTPTIIKALWRPQTEYSWPYLLSMLSMLITCGSLTRWTFATAAFPLYIFGVNALLFSLSRFRRRRHLWMRAGQLRRL